MANLYPLRALRYTAKAGSLDNLATLPYDVIGEELEADYRARSPYNFVSLILPHGDYAGAAARLRAWISEGVLAQDSEEALFVYEQVFPSPADGAILTRRGFIGLSDTEDYGKTVFRHERTMSGPKEDRFRLLEATRVQFDSIFMLFPDADGAVEKKLAAVCAAPHDGEYTDQEKTLHRIWRVTSPEWIAAMRQLMAPKPLLIADGHHRYETALRMGHPRTMMTFVSLESPGLRSFATHRIVHSVAGFSDPAFLEKLATVGTVRKGGRPEDFEQRPSGKMRFGVLLASGYWEVEIPGAEAELNVASLQERILTPLLGITPEVVTAGTNLRYKRTLKEAVAEVREHGAQIAFLLEDLPVDAVARISFSGVCLPQKSTFFYPKLGSGLVLYPLE
jgi:uncharacterized protein (DUF1015 family)